MVRTFLVLLLLVVLMPAPPAEAQSCRAINLRVNALENPISVDSSQPRFSWQMADSRRGARQIAYRIVVASTPETARADLWDSGRVTSADSIEIPYAGKP